MKDTGGGRVVLICGSAGSVQPFLEMLPELEQMTQNSYIYLVHSQREEPPVLGPLIEFKTPLNVIVVKEPRRVQAGQLYIAEPGHHIQFESGDIVPINDENSKNGPSLFVPSFNWAISSAAREYKERLLVVILSGLMDDGIESLLEVYELGGDTIVQDPEDAKFSSMPLEAIKRDHPKAILPADEIPKEIIRRLQS
jgi:chemotaxis response regulator CheB